MLIITMTMGSQTLSVYIFQTLFNVNKVVKYKIKVRVTTGCEVEGRIRKIDGPFYRQLGAAYQRDPFLWSYIQNMDFKDRRT